MNAESVPDRVPQRWEREWIYSVPAGFWKRQLPVKYLQIAAQNNVEALRELISEHPDYLNKRSSHNRTLLWEAVRRGKLPAVRWLVEQGADVNATACYNGESMIQLTPYCAAVYYRRGAIAEYLAAQGSLIDIFRAAFLGDQARVARELDAQPDLLNAEDPHDSLYYMPLLAFAVVGGHAALLNFLLERGAIVEPYSTLLIFLAGRNGRIDLIERLIAHGADLRAVDAGIAMNGSDLAVTRYLLDHGVSPSKIGKSGFPPLIFYARGDKGEHPERLQLLLDYGADVNAVGPKGRTALHYAAVVSHLRVIDLLLDHGADTSIRDERGETALDLARAAGKSAAVDLLTRRSAIRSVERCRK